MEDLIKIMGDRSLTYEASNGNTVFVADVLLEVFEEKILKVKRAMEITTDGSYYADLKARYEFLKALANANPLHRMEANR